MRAKVVEDGSFLVEQGFYVYQFERPDTVLKQVLAAFEPCLALVRGDSGLLQIAWLGGSEYSRTTSCPVYPRNLRIFNQNFTYLSTAVRAHDDDSPAVELRIHFKFRSEKSDLAHNAIAHEI
jgi:hypothetical protein